MTKWKFKTATYESIVYFDNWLEAVEEMITLADDMHKELGEVLQLHANFKSIIIVDSNDLTLASLDQIYW